MNATRTLLLALALPFVSSAHASVFKCVDANGNVTYTNDRALARDCEPLNPDLPVSSIPPPSRTPAPPAPPAAKPSSRDFPRVAPGAQQQRDDSRRRILENELDAEEAALREAREKLEAEQERDAPEDRNVVRKTADGRTYRSINLEKREERLEPYRNQVELHERNIEALEREISGLR